MRGPGGLGEEVGIERDRTQAASAGRREARRKGSDRLGAREISGQ